MKRLIVELDDSVSGDFLDMLDWWSQASDQDRQMAMKIRAADEQSLQLLNTWGKHARVDEIEDEVEDGTDA